MLSRVLMMFISQCVAMVTHKVSLQTEVDFMISRDFHVVLTYVELTWTTTFINFNLELPVL